MARELLEKLVVKHELVEDELRVVFDQILDGCLPEAQVAAFLACWRMNGEGPLELTVGARALRARAMEVMLPSSARPLVDNCGTGGDGSNSFNISTAAAIVVASSGINVAKHGNRSVSSRCGSADLLFEAGFPQELTPEAAGELLGLSGFSFFFAPIFHPAMKRVMPVRRELGVRTIFNLLGPLANPIAPEMQLIGVGAKTLIRPMAEALCNLGVKTALVVHSRDGLDEISTAAPTDGIYLRNEGLGGSRLDELVINPSDLGVSAPLSELAGGDAAFNLSVLDRVLRGERCGAAEAVAVNAGALFWLTGATTNLADGVKMAKEQLSKMVVREYFYRWIDAARSLGMKS